MGSSSGSLLTSPSSAVALLLLLLSLGDAAAADAEEAGRRERVTGLTRQQGTYVSYASFRRKYKSMQRYASRKNFQKKW